MINLSGNFITFISHFSSDKAISQLFTTFSNKGISIAQMYRALLLSLLCLANASCAFLTNMFHARMRMSLHETPSWEELSSILENESSPAPAPMLTLYRDTNGWCPFCERVWLALEIKGIPYKERLVNLQNKPDWFLDMVPTGLVPAVMLYDEKEEEASTNTQRTLIWESLDIMKALDEKFPDTERLILDDLPEYKEAEELMSQLTSSGFGYIYAERNETLTEEEKFQKKIDFERDLNKFDTLVEKNGGPFLLGAKVSGIDLQIVPAMERWRYQLPLAKDMHIMDGRPNIQKWFEDGMDKLPAYADRVAGDEYSWTAVSSYFLKIFMGNGGDPSPASLEAIKRSDEAANALTAAFIEGGSNSPSAKSTLKSEEIARLAASKIISNHENIIADCTSDKPKSQTDMKRATSPNSADTALRAIACQLLNQTKKMKYPDFETPEDAMDAALALRTIAGRLCVPRDMGAPAAAELRKVLSIMANDLEKENEPKLSETPVMSA